MTGLSVELQRSQDHESDALTFLEVAQQAGAAVAQQAGALDNPLAEAAALYRAAINQAQLHATLSAAAASRAVAAGIGDLRAELEALLRRV